MPPPEFIELGPVQRRRAGQPVVAGGYAGLLVGRLPVEAEQRRADLRARNTRGLVEVDAEIDDEQVVETGSAGVVAARQQIVPVADEHAAQPEAGRRVEAKQPPQRAHSRLDIDRTGIACDPRTVCLIHGWAFGRATRRRHR